MAVYEHHYKPYAGALTRAWSRFLVIPRYAYEDLFQLRFFIALYALCFVAPLIFTILIYLHHNVTALAVFQLDAASLIPINGNFFQIFMSVQSGLAFLMTVVIGPVLISRDLANNGLPLYLSRPFTRTEYILGKMAVLGLMLSSFTWVPGLLLFLFQGYLAGGGWMLDNWWIGGAILTVSGTQITLLSMLAMAFSAWLKWRTAASAALFAIFIIPTPIGLAIEEIFRTRLGHLFNPGMAIAQLTRHLFRTIGPDEYILSLGESWLVCLGYALVALWMLSRKVRAYEVIS
jgi:ABC-2 type transport system permease protein